MLDILEPISTFWRSLYLSFPTGIQGWTLAAFRASVGFLFILHGYPKLNNLKLWSEGLKMPIFLCFLSASSMFLGGICLIIGFLTPLAAVVILVSMLFALYLEITQGLPFVAIDPYLIPPGEYEGEDGKGEPPSQEKAFVFSMMLILIAVFGPGIFSIDAWLINSL